MATWRSSFICSLALALPATADTFYVNGAAGNDAWDGRCEVWNGQTCGPKKTIQAGINAAADGDELLVASGTYSGPGNRDLMIAGAAIAVRGVGGAQACVIDCELAGRGFRFDAIEGADLILEGFTITNGLADSGGGIYCTAAGPLIRDCRIIGNDATFRGGGIMCEGGAPTLLNCVIESNTVLYDGHDGGGLMAESSNITVQDCTIRFNAAAAGIRGDGGGIYIYRGSPAIRNCLISENRSDYAGGGAYLRLLGSASVVENCVISANVAGTGGGGLWLMDGGPTIRACDVRDNRALTADGGGIKCDASSRIENCVVSGNIAYLGSGGGINVYLRNPIIVNCTIIGNQSLYGAGGLHVERTSGSMTNSIAWNNPPASIRVNNQPFAVTYCLSDGVPSGNGNLDVDPGFSFPDEPYPLPGSNCVDAGTNSPPGGLPQTDREGVARPLDGNGDGQSVADIGAFELNAVRPRIAAAARRVELRALLGDSAGAHAELALRNAGGDTLRWQISSDCSWLTPEPASGESTDEIDVVELLADTQMLPAGLHPCEVRIHDPAAVNAPRVVQMTVRVYRERLVPSQHATIQEAIDESDEGDVILLDDGVYRGAGNTSLDFGGKDLILRSLNGPAACIIDCEGAGRAVIFQSYETTRSLISGMTFTNGNHPEGGAMKILRSAPRIEDCIFSNCSSTSGGGALSVSQASPTIDRCEFTGNRAPTGDGGALHITRGWGRVSNCTFTNNEGRGGGAITAGVGRPTIEHCLVSGNRTPLIADGGGVQLASSTATLSDCVIEFNVARGYGGGVSVYGEGESHIQRCIIRGNQADQEGGGVAGNGALRIIDSMIVDNVANEWDSRGGGLSFSRDGRVDSCTIADNVANGSQSTGGGVYVAGVEVLVGNSIFWGNRSTDGDQVFNAGQMAVRASDVEGGYAAVRGGGILTWEGNIDANPRFVNAAEADYHLSPDSPCRDSGEARECLPQRADIDGEPRIMGGRVDRGADEVVAPAGYLAGDVNCDCSLDAFDIDAFIVALIDPASYPPRFPTCDISSADIDGSGRVDAFDIEPFVQILIGP